VDIFRETRAKPKKRFSEIIKEGNAREQFFGFFYARTRYGFVICGNNSRAGGGNFCVHKGL
jgi:hypothetical protein